MRHKISPETSNMTLHNESNFFTDTLSAHEMWGMGTK